MTVKDHERIWLQNPNDARNQSEGRMWREDKAWRAEDGDLEPTEYVRADISNTRIVSLVNQLADQSFKLGELKGVLRSLVNDIRSMQSPAPDLPYWFGPFSEFDNNIEAVDVEWPNLAISCEEAEKLLKEIG